MIKINTIARDALGLLWVVKNIIKKQNKDNKARDTSRALWKWENKRKEKKIRPEMRLGPYGDEKKKKKKKKGLRAISDRCGDEEKNKKIENKARDASRALCGEKKKTKE